MPCLEKKKKLSFDVAHLVEVIFSYYGHSKAALLRLSVP